MLAHLAKIKPAKGWREFLGEVGIIVLGVMIALMADKIAQHVSDNDTASDTRADIGDELNDGLAAMVMRQKTEPCIDRRLREVRALLTQWQTKGNFATPQWVAQTPELEVASSRYQAEQSAGHLALLPSDEQYRMGAVIEGLTRFDKMQHEERAAWGRLRALQMGAAALSSDDKAIILAALQDASTLDYEVRVALRQLLPMARRFGYTPDYERIEAIAGDMWSDGKFTPTICLPIDTPRDQGNKTQMTPLGD